MLTDKEQKALMLSGQLAGMVRAIIGEGPCAEQDWQEAAHHIHNIQRMIMAQSAGRNHPNLCRLLGEKL